MTATIIDAYPEKELTMLKLTLSATLLASAALALPALSQTAPQYTLIDNDEGESHGWALFRFSDDDDDDEGARCQTDSKGQCAPLATPQTATPPDNGLFSPNSTPATTLN
jgi:hypothetical protein